MSEAQILGNFSGNDIELCRTTSVKVGNRIVQALLDASIPFTKNCKKIPFFQRLKYDGAEQIFVITINPSRYGQARQVVDKMDTIYKKRLVVTNF